MKRAHAIAGWYLIYPLASHSGPELIPTPGFLQWNVDLCQVTAIEGA
jgi:hypothetical protein